LTVRVGTSAQQSLTGGEDAAALSPRHDPGRKRADTADRSDRAQHVSAARHDGTHSAPAPNPAA